MSGQGPEKALTLERRMEVFAALVEAQDSNMTIAQSRKATAERFGLTEQQVRRIEQEGLDEGDAQRDAEQGEKRLSHRHPVVGGHGSARSFGTGGRGFSP